jgi:hypothetical protein
MRSEKTISQEAKLAIVLKHLFLVFYTRATGRPFNTHISNIPLARLNSPLWGDIVH